MFPTHLTGQSSVLVGLAGGRRRSRTVQRAPVLVVPAFAGGVRRLRAEGLLGVAESLLDFVGDEAMARQGGGGGETGAALQTLQPAALRTRPPVLADVLQEGGLVLGGEAAGGAAKPRLRRSVGPRLLHRTRVVCGLFIPIDIRSSSPSPANHRAAVLF